MNITNVSIHLDKAICLDSLILPGLPLHLSEFHFDVFGARKSMIDYNHLTFDRVFFETTTPKKPSLKKKN